MNYKLLTVILLLCVSSSYAQKYKLPRRVEQSIVHLIKTDNIMVDQYEVTLGDWFAFINSLYQSGVGFDGLMGFVPNRDKIPFKMRKAYDLYVDQIKNKEFGSEYEFGVNSLQSFPVPAIDTSIDQYYDFPVTGVTFHQVEEYLLWREGLVNDEKYMVKQGLRVRARLPTPEEWDEAAAYLGVREPDNATIYPDTANLSGCYMMNIRVKAPCESTKALIAEMGDGLFKTASYYPDLSGVYDFYGNVAEMTSEEGIAKGASYKHWGSQGFSGKNIEYAGPEDWLGFRVYFEFLPLKK